MAEENSSELARDAIEFHAAGRPGKLEIRASSMPPADRVSWK
jgi:hypothetical protein